MVEEQGRVIAIEKGFVWVEIRKSSGCSGCSTRCGQHLFEQYHPGAAISSRIRAHNCRALREGDQVVVGIKEDSLLKASFFLYLFPLLLMMIGMWLTAIVGLNDLWLLLGAGFGLLCGFLLVRILGKHRSDDICTVEVVKVLPAEGASSLAANDGYQSSFRH